VTNPLAMETESPRSVITVSAVAALVANLYDAQPLIASIGPDVGMTPELAGSLVSVTQVGYWYNATPSGSTPASAT